MKAYDAKSDANLERAANVLGNTDTVRLMVQMIYNLGVVDGKLQQLDKTIARLNADTGDHRDVPGFPGEKAERTYPDAPEYSTDGRKL